MAHLQPIVFLIDVVVAAFPPADVTFEHIADLLEVDLPRPRLRPPNPASSLESRR
jgi:hypothetical protein